mgnify:CR=1 FL=1
MIIEGRKVTGITCNSKKVQKGYVFVAIEGLKVDGNKYIDEAISKGASVIFTEKDVQKDNIPIIKVKDARKKLALLLKEYYDNPTEKLFVIGVTGTNGKTTTVHLLDSIFNKAGISTALIGTLGIKIGNKYIKNNLTTPDAEYLYELFDEFVNKKVKVVIMEVSSHALKFSRTYGIEYDIAIHTNIEIDHMDIHDSFTEYVNTKKILFDSLKRNKLAIINTDDDNSSNLLEGNDRVLTITYGLNSKASVTASSISETDKISFNICIQRSITTLSYNEIEPSEFKINTNLIGIHNIYNSLAAISASLFYGINIEDIQDALIDFKGVPRRLEFIYDGDFTVIDDFCHNPSSYQAVLDTVRSLNYNNLIIVNSIRGNRGKDINYRNAEVLASWYSTLNNPSIILSLGNDVVKDKDKVTNEESNAYRKIFNKEEVRYEEYSNLKDSIRAAVKKALKNDMILLIGPQGMNSGKEILYEVLENY